MKMKDLNQINKKISHKSTSKIQQICKNLEKKIAYIVTML
jgi:hypothetical protein